MKKIVQMAAVAAVAAGASSMALAAPSFYVGAQAGYQNVDMEEKESWGNASFTTDYSMTGLAGGVFAGAKFHLTPEFYLAPEVNLGTSNADGGDRFNMPGYSASYEFEAGRSYGIGVLAGYNVTPATSVYGRLGYQRTKFKVSYNETGEPTESDSENFSGARFGVGMDTALSSNVALRLDWSHTPYSSKSYEDEWGDRITFDPTESLFQVGVLVSF
ncbi:outer membrane protein [Halomonas sp. E14]|uniref:outer membrane protein n=1 Tax=Halomonas sp. E14 TaxID=3397245 RepID=UPI00403E78C0